MTIVLNLFQLHLSGNTSMQIRLFPFQPLNFSLSHPSHLIRFILLSISPLKCLFLVLYGLRQFLQIVLLLHEHSQRPALDLKPVLPCLVQDHYAEIEDEAFFGIIRRVKLQGFLVLGGDVFV